MRLCKVLPFTQHIFKFISTIMHQNKVIIPNDYRYSRNGRGAPRGGLRI